jgi:hypothetical protein
VQRLHANRSKTREYHWDKRHIAQVRRRFAADFRNFGYE